jgi:pantoate--beta-alanine ligase
MQVLATASGLRTALADARRKGLSIGFVPTMGALHEGHLSLVRAARSASEVVVLSIFVNPLQFGPKEDFSAYPRATKQDLAAADAAGVDVVFLPEVEEMYPREPQVSVMVGGLGDVLEGASRPGHFDGVATVVTKLFNLVQPTRAFFGQKDAQQVAVIKALIRDLSLDVELVVCPTVREPDGLAMSSRNAYLSPEQRARATILHRALEAGSAAHREAGDPTLTEKRMTEVLEADPDVDIDYARAVDPDDFSAAESGQPVLLVVAAKLGRTRLIDNMLVAPGEAQSRRGSS